MDIRERAQIFLDEYKALCIKHNLLLIGTEKSSKGMHIAGITNGEIMGYGERLKIDDIFEGLKSAFR